jgi:hypothetical protein
MRNGSFGLPRVGCEGGGMTPNIRTALSKPAVAQQFAASFVEGYLTPAFGARSKSEIDLLVFTCLIEAKAIDPDDPIYDIARALNITPPRARSLVMNWQLRSTSIQKDLRDSIQAALKRSRFSKDGTQLAFGVESPLVKEEIVARLKRKGIFPDASFAREIIRLPVESFVEFLDEIVDEDTKKQVRSTLVKDKQLPDKSFKALAIGILSKLGEKVAGEFGKDIAADMVGKIAKPTAEKAITFLTGMLAGDAKAATKALTKDDYSDV